jgi:FMN phosphatase YigB (HAD superfamily)
MIEVVIFDWGDTVMRDFPQYAGPMVEWPRVEAVPGIADALRALSPDFRLALATNAAASGAEKARAALARVGLDTYFTYVLTARELGVSAKHASLLAVWYNPRRDSAPPEVPITPDATIHDLGDLAAAIRDLDRRAAGEM